MIDQLRIAETSIERHVAETGSEWGAEILRDAPDHLREHGLLICEVGESRFMPPTANQGGAPQTPHA